MSWFKEDPKPVPTNELLPTSHVDPKKVEYFKAGGKGKDEPVGYVVGEDGQKYLVDGNHRVMAAIANNEPYTSAGEVDLPEDVRKGWFSKIFG